MLVEEFRQADDPQFMSGTDKAPVAFVVVVPVPPEPPPEQALKRTKTDELKINVWNKFCIPKPFEKNVNKTMIYENAKTIFYRGQKVKGRG